MLRLDGILMTNIKCSSNIWTTSEIMFLSEGKHPYAIQSALFYRTNMFSLVQLIFRFSEFKKRGYLPLNPEGKYSHASKKKFQHCEFLVLRKNNYVKTKCFKKKHPRIYPGEPNIVRVYMKEYLQNVLSRDLIPTWKTL